MKNSKKGHKITKVFKVHSYCMWRLWKNLRKFEASDDVECPKVKFKFQK